MSIAPPIAATDGTDQRPLVAHVIHRLDVGGMENGLVNLINHMPAAHYRHAIICMTDYTDFSQRIRRADVGLYALHKREGKDVGVHWRLRRLLRELQPAIVHHPQPGHPGGAGHGGGGRGADAHPRRARLGRG